MRATLYLRISLDKSGEELGVQRQEAECRRLCEQRGWDVIGVITDNSVSASRGVRPGYKQLLRAIEAHETDVVVVYRLDRLLRRLTELEALVELSERTGVQVATVQGDLDLTNSSGRLVARILASVARSEVETKSERQRLANAQKAAAGKPQGSRRPYGYERDLITIYEPEAAVLREMAAKVIAGWGYKEVAYWANAEGHTTTMGRPWLGLTIRNILQKKRYGGIREYNGAEYPAIWQPIFDKQTWERLQLTIKLHKQSYADPSRAFARKYLLTGLVYCGQCGMPLNGATKRDPSSNREKREGIKRPLRRTYHCRVQGDTKRERGCGGVTRNADALEHWVTECVFYRLDTPALAKLLQGSRDDAELRELLEQRDLQRLRLDELVDDYASGLLTRAQLARAKATAEATLKVTEGRLSALQRQHAVIDVPAGQTLREAWDKSESTDWKRNLLSLVVKRIDVRPGLSKPVYELPDGRKCRFDPSLITITWME